MGCTRPNLNPGTHSLDDHVVDNTEESNLDQSTHPALVRPQRLEEA